VPPVDNYDSQYQEKLELFTKRTNTVYNVLKDLRNTLDTNEEILIINGGARGVDFLGFFHGRQLGYEIRTYKAMWDLYGAGAGPIRNKEMLDKNFDVVRCLAFHDDLVGKSKGTLDMCRYARKKDVPVIVYRSDGSYYDFDLPKQTRFA
jgi:hypothetical protein